MKPKQQESFDPTGIPRAVKKAGFSPGEINLVAAGTLQRKDGTLALKMSGPLSELQLDGGAQAAELEKRSDLAGKRVRVHGKFVPGESGHPARLTVESWELAASPR